MKLRGECLWLILDTWMLKVDDSSLLCRATKPNPDWAISELSLVPDFNHTSSTKTSVKRLSAAMEARLIGGYKEQKLFTHITSQSKWTKELNRHSGLSKHIAYPYPSADIHVHRACDRVLPLYILLFRHSSHFNLPLSIFTTISSLQWLLVSVLTQLHTAKT